MKFCWGYNFFVFLLPFLIVSLHGIVPEKVLICGVAKNVEKAVFNTICSAEALGDEFTDYQVVIYENNSSDLTKQLFSNWASQNKKVLFISENVIEGPLREGRIARARNKILDLIMSPQYDSYKYVVMVDLDQRFFWDVQNIVDSVENPECEWDAVFANGSYDQYALRAPEVPIGFELVGPYYWGDLYGSQTLRTTLAKINFWGQPNWRKVYSAFGGLGIYKRDAIRGCRYSEFVTKDLECVIRDWLEDAYLDESTPLLEDYRKLLEEVPIYDIREERVSSRQNYPEVIGVRLYNERGCGDITWFSCQKGSDLPFTCEHIPFHASMTVRGHDKLYINPRLKSLP